MTQTPQAGRMGMVDTAWLRMDQPTNRMVIGGVLRLDGEPDARRLARVLERRLVHAHPRFHQRVVTSAAGARWVEDDRFRLADHLHRMRLDDVDDEASLRRLIGEIMSRPLDPERALWDTHLIVDGRGGCVLLTRVHHCMGDGTALVQAMEAITDASAAGRRRGPSRHADSGSSLSRRLLGLLDPLRGPRLAVSAVASAYTLARLVLLDPDPPSTFRGRLGRQKVVAWTRPVRVHDLDEIRELEQCTVNDIVVTAVGGALRRYIERASQQPLPRRLRAMVPVDLRARPSDHATGNYFGLVFLDLPLQPADPFARLALVHTRMERARHSPEPSVALGVLGLLALGPAFTQRLMVRFFGTKGTAVVTNVRGPAQARYIAGRRIVSQVFFVPQSAELGVGISIYSYAGDLRVGVIADAHLVPHPEALAADIEAEMDALLHPRSGPVATLIGHHRPHPTRRASQGMRTISS